MKKMVQAGIRNKALAVLLLFAGFLACNNPDQPKGEPEVKQERKPGLVSPPFNADTAYHYTEIQTLFGPRVPNTEAHVKCGDFLIETLRQMADTVYVQSAIVKAFDGTDLRIRNIIGSFRPTLANRIMLCAHWDSRPFADQDSNDTDKPIIAANDGAASCAVLLEIGRILKQQMPAVGVDIILFDAEDYGQPVFSKLPEVEDSYCLGSQYWSRNMHIPGYNASFGILLDMVGAENATFYMEGTSMQYASAVVKTVWENAHHAGFSDYFIFKESSAIIDDHFYINRITGIPVIDIVHRDPATLSNFWKHWHTHDDTMDKISRNSLKAAGQTVLETIYRNSGATGN